MSVSISKDDESTPKSPSVEEGEIEDISDLDSAIPPEVLDSLPPPMRRHVSETFAMISGGPSSPLASKITESHITKIIENESSDSARGYDLVVGKRRYVLFYVIIGIATFFMLAWMFAKSDPELFKDIISHFAAIVAGFAAGWGFTAVNSSKD